MVGVSLFPITIPSTPIVLRELNLKGDIAYTEKEFDDCIDFIATKRINVNKYISAIVGLEEGQASFERLTSGKDSAIKIILRPDMKDKKSKPKKEKPAKVKTDKPEKVKAGKTTKTEKT